MCMETQKERYQRLKDDGLCVSCAAQAMPGRAQCSDCREKYGQKRYRDLKSSGLCVHCAREEVAPGKVSCKSCLEKKKQNGEAANKYHRSFYRKKKSEGICYRCSEVVVPGKSMCSACTEKNKLKSKKNIIRKKGLGLCVSCGKKQAVRGTKCDECAEKVCFRLRQVRKHRVQNGLCIKCGAHNPAKNNYCEVCHVKAILAHNKTVSWREVYDLFNAQQGLCPYTGRKLTLGEDAELDHKYPKCRGGSDELSNLQWVHRWVNRMKDAMTHEEFLALVEEIWAHQKRMSVA